MLDALLRRRTDRVIDGTNARTLGQACRGQDPQPRSGAPKAQDLTAIRMAEAQFAVPSGAPPPLPSPRHTPTLSLHANLMSPRATHSFRRGPKKTGRRYWRRVARRHGADPGDIELWFGDEARIGQKNKITRRWARRGSRPSAPSDQRTTSTYIFGAICPKHGKAVGLILPWCNTAMMNLHLAAISADVAPGRHAVLLARPGRLASLRQTRRCPTTSPSCCCRRSVPS